MEMTFQVMEEAMGTATTTSTPVSQVDDLIKQVMNDDNAAIVEMIFYQTLTTI
jgi:hypothetical protein